MNVVRKHPKFGKRMLALELECLASKMRKVARYMQEHEDEIKEHSKELINSAYNVKTWATSIKRLALLSNTSEAWIEPNQELTALEIAEFCLQVAATNSRNLTGREIRSALLIIFGEEVCQQLQEKMKTGEKSVGI
jgi:hypothetical protein